MLITLFDLICIRPQRKKRLPKSSRTKMYVHMCFGCVICNENRSIAIRNMVVLFALFSNAVCVCVCLLFARYLLVGYIKIISSVGNHNLSNSIVQLKRRINLNWIKFTTDCPLFMRIALFTYPRTIALSLALFLIVGIPTITDCNGFLKRAKVIAKYISCSSLRSLFGCLYGSRTIFHSLQWI